MDIKDYIITGLGTTTVALFGYSVYVYRQRKAIEKKIEEFQKLVDKASETMNSAVKEAEKKEPEKEAKEE